MIRRLLRKIKRKLGFLETYASETSKVRHLVIEYCQGHGCDIGFGGDKIKKTDCVGIDFAQPYAQTGKDKVDISCDVMKEKIPVADDTFDYVYTSHLIEDFVDTKAALEEFIRILKPGGNLILVFPDQPLYEKYCRRTGQPLNLYHIHRNMGLTYMQDHIKQMQNISFTPLLENDCTIDYNVILIAKIIKNGNP